VNRLFPFAKGFAFSAVFAVLPVVFAIMAGRSFVLGQKFTAALTWQVIAMLVFAAILFTAQVLATLKLKRSPPDRQHQSYWTMVGIWSIYPSVMLMNVFTQY
jgi:hypothetical protein